jgi:polysaccharide export outer membrane protein
MCFAILLILSGCADPVVNPAPLDEIKPAASNLEPAPYKIGMGDEIEIKFFFAPELNDKMQVRPDGKISIMFAQDVQAAGQTPEQLADAIKKALASHVKQLDLVVIVRNFGSQRVFIGGEVFKPGPVQLAAPESMLQVLTEAGWITPHAGPEKIILVRRNPGGKESLYPVEVDKLISGEDLSQNIIVKPGDFILVPPSDSVAADRWVDRNIRQILPFNTTAGAYYNMTTGGM